MEAALPSGFYSLNLFFFFPLLHVLLDEANVRCAGYITLPQPISLGYILEFSLFCLKLFSHVYLMLLKPYPLIHKSCVPKYATCV